jgi:hypothetical protein
MANRQIDEAVDRLATPVLAGALLHSAAKLGGRITLPQEPFEPIEDCLKVLQTCGGPICCVGGCRGRLGLKKLTYNRSDVPCVNVVGKR